MNAVTCLKWVRQGAAKNRPDKIQLDDEELKGLVKGLKETALDESSDEEPEDRYDRKRKLPKGKENTGVDEAKDKAKKEKETEDIDEEGSDDSDEEYNPVGMSGIAYYASASEDPVLSKDPDSDDEDIEILPDDNLIAVGKVNKDYCNLEVYVYNERDGNCWCHHDYILPTIPLCLEWLDFDPTSEEPGNYVAIGTMGPDIEIWDLDVLETLEPAFVLAGSKKAGKSDKKKKKKSSSNGHTDAVLDLAWNKSQRHILASASADFTVGLWDLEEGKLVTRIPHKEKVSSIQWHPTSNHVLLTGSSDCCVRVCDCINMEPDVKKWKLSGEVESVLWDPSKDNNFLCSTEDGNLYYIDCRQNMPLFEIKAHEESITGMTFSSSLEGCLVTVSSDKTIKLWDTKLDSPKLVHSKKLTVGQLFCVSECPDSALKFAVGGERELQVLNLNRVSAVADYYKLSSAEGEAEVIPIGMDDNDEGSEDELLQETMAVGKKEKPAEVKDTADKTEGKKKKKKKKKKNKKPAETNLTEAAA